MSVYLDKLILITFTVWNVLFVKADKLHSKVTLLLSHVRVQYKYIYIYIIKQYLCNKIFRSIFVTYMLVFKNSKCILYVKFNL